MFLPPGPIRPQSKHTGGWSERGSVLVCVYVCVLPLTSSNASLLDVNETPPLSRQLVLQSAFPPLGADKSHTLDKFSLFFFFFLR